MYEEKRVWMAFKLSRIFRKHSTFYAFKAQKNESLTHSLFFDSSRSKVIFRVTRKPCSCRGLPTIPPSARWLLLERSSTTEACCSRWSHLLGIRFKRTCLCPVRFTALSDGQCPIGAACNL